MDGGCSGRVSLFVSVAIQAWSFFFAAWPLAIFFSGGGSPLTSATTTYSIGFFAPAFLLDTQLRFAVLTRFKVAETSSKPEE